MIELNFSPNPPSLFDIEAQTTRPQPEQNCNQIKDAFRGSQKDKSKDSDFDGKLEQGAEVRCHRVYSNFKRHRYSQQG